MLIGRNKLFVIVPLLICTLAIFIIMVRVWLGLTGCCESWRMYFSIISFLGIMFLDFALLYHLGKKSVKT